MALQPRKLLMFVLLALTFTAAFVDWPGGESAVIEQGGPASGAATKTRVMAKDSKTGTAMLNSTRAIFLPVSPRFEESAFDLFAVKSWKPQAAVVSPVLAKPMPAPIPAVPLIYLGKLVQAEGIQVFLGHGSRTYVVQQGDSVAGYVIDQITLTEVTFTHQQSNEKNRLLLGSAN